MGIKTKKIIMGFAAILAFATISSNVKSFNINVNAKTHHTNKKSTKKSVNKAKKNSNQSSQSLLNKAYTSNEASQILKQKFIDMVNKARSSNAKQPWILNDKLSKLADSRAQSYINIVTKNTGYVGAGYDFATKAGNGDSTTTTQKGAYLDGVQLGIFPDDPSISDNIAEITEDYPLSNQDSDQIHYTNIQYLEQSLQNYLNSNDFAEQTEFNQGGGSANNILGNVGNGQNYYGLSIKTFSDNHRLVLELITSDTNY